MLFDNYLGVRMEYILRDFTENNGFLDFAEDRKDDVYRASVYFARKIAGPLSIFASYSYERSDSNIDVFDFRRYVMTAGFLVNY